VLLQQVLVGALVAACALYSAWRLASVALRLRALAALAKLPGMQRVPWLAALRARTLARQLSACGGCAQSAAHTAAVSRAPGQGRAARRDAPSRNQTPGALRR
jgi:hypothetical protein